MPATGPTSGLSAVLDCYRELARLEREPGSSHRTWNAVSDRLSSALRPVVQDPQLLAALREVGRSDPDPVVRRYAAGDADPPAPADLDDVRTWLEHPAVGLSAVAAQVRPARVLVEHRREALDPEDLLAAARYDEHDDSSWAGGQPLGPLPTWPRREDGVALVHVAQIDLRPGPWVDPPGVPAPEGLPRTGVLQVFHDLETSGYEPGDDATGAWLVRWVESPGELVPAPPDASGPTAAWALLTQGPGATLPCPDDLDEAETAERCERARHALVATRLLLEGDARRQYLRPLSHLLGHGWHSEREARDLLEAATGVEADDWLLLADVSGTRALDAWFGDEGHLEVWVRAADLARGAFDQARVLLR